MSKSKPVKAEIVKLGPGMEARSQSDSVNLQTLAAQLALVISGKQDGAIFEPFFRTRQVSYELRRLQNVAEQEKWSTYFEQFGCLSCGKDGKGHGGCGCCYRCYARVGNRLRAIVKERMNGDR
jgi:hypothetical protein